MGGYLRELRRLVGSRPLIHCGASVILEDERGRLLLARRSDNGLWALPGGSMEPGETLEETARRETAEEVGLTCGPLHLLDIYSGPSVYYRYPNGDEVFNVIASYHCREWTGQVVPEEGEMVDARWFALTELPAGISPPDRVVIEGYLARRGTGK